MVGRFSWSFLPAGARRPRLFAAIPGEKSRGLQGPDGSPHEVSFADAFPFLVIARVARRSQRSARCTLPMDRFRPIWSSRRRALREDLGAVSGSAKSFSTAPPRCGRLVVTTTDQLTAETRPGTAPHAGLPTAATRRAP